MEPSDLSSVKSFVVTPSTNKSDIDELTLFGVVSPSTSDAESVDSDLVRELERQIEDVVTESYGSLCIPINEHSIVEVACTKQTAWKQPQGLPMATSPPPANGGGGNSNPPVGTSGSGGGGKSPRAPLPKKVM